MVVFRKSLGCIKKRGKPFGRTVPPKNSLFGGTVPPNNTQFHRTVLPNSTLFGRTLNFDKPYPISIVITQP